MEKEIHHIIKPEEFDLICGQCKNHANMKGECQGY
jgi:hypothetical protein